MTQTPLSEHRLALDWTKAHDVFPLEKKLSDMLPRLVQAKRDLLAGTGAGSAFTGWVHHITDQALQDLEAMQELVETVTSHSDALVVVGIGGSLLGTQAIYDALIHGFAVLQQALGAHKKPVLLWAGHHVATDAVAELLDVLDHYTPSVVVVSKSGGTTEPALAFRILKNYLDQRFGPKETAHRVICITEDGAGTLSRLAKSQGFPMLSIPKSIGGRYSVFTSVSLFPLSVAGLDTRSLLEGARYAYKDCTSQNNDSLETNVALCYAGIRNCLYQAGYKVEVLCSWTPKLAKLAEWWKQLFGESDGKQGAGLFPASAQFTTDLHSLGQYFQEGERMLFASHVHVQQEGSFVQKPFRRLVQIPKVHGQDHPWDDGFDFLNTQDLSFVQNQASLGTFLAHCDGQVPTLVWEMPKASEFWLGYWMFTQMFACAVGGYERGINPFDQPGVEAYKEHMFALIGKPTSRAAAVEIRARLDRSARLRSLGLSTFS